jgi:hypothetical protein
MKLIDRILRLYTRQLINDNVRPVLHLSEEHFWGLFSELQMMTRPAFCMPQVVWNFWVCKIMPQFVEGNDLRVLGYRIKVI